MAAPLSYDGLTLIMCGHTAFQLCWSAQRLKVFDLLSPAGGLTDESLRLSIALHERPFSILLTGLLALRLVERRADGKLHNAEIVDQFLVRSTPENWVDALAWQGHIVYPGEQDLLSSLVNNTNVGLHRFPAPGDHLYARLANDPALEKIFQDAMVSLSSSTPRFFATAQPFVGRRRLVDLGGGDGSNAIAAVRAHPGLAATVFDQPTVCARARARIASAGFSDRVDTYPGDLFTTAFPSGYDAALMAHLATIWSPENNVRLMRRVYQALPSGGLLAVYGMFGNDDGTGPMSAALGSPYFLSIATGEGMLHPISAVVGMLQVAGFASISRQALERDHWFICGTRP